MTKTTDVIDDDAPPALDAGAEGGEESGAGEGVTKGPDPVVVAAPKAAKRATPKAPHADNAHVAKGAEKVPELSARVTIIIDEPNNAPSNQQFFGHNGKGFLITFGEPVSVPRELLNVLNECVQTRTIPQEGGGFVERDSLRFSYRIVG